MSRNDEVAGRLELFADLLEATGVEYKPRAYRRAAENVREHPAAVEELAAEGPEAVRRIEGVGEAIAAKIVEYVETGRIEELADLREELPVDMAALTRVEGLGPKRVGALYDALGVRDLADLAAAAEAGEVRTVEGFGPKTEANLREAVAFARAAAERERLGRARPLAAAAADHLRELEAVERVAVAGSVRRWRPTVGDVDLLAASADGPAVTAALADWEAAVDAVEAGDAKASVRAAVPETEGRFGGAGGPLRVDLRVVAPGEFGAARQYFTGSVEHNVRLRALAADRGLKLNEYGLFRVADRAEAAAGGDGDGPTAGGDGDGPTAGEEGDGEDGDPRAGERVAGETEVGVYDALGLPAFPPELREDGGEFEAAREGSLPDLVTTGGVRGDLHAHTDWSDGNSTVREMVAAAADRGYDYHCVTDHAAGPGVIGGYGLSPADLREQAAEVADVAAEADIGVFHGVEANVDADGDIGLGEDLLADLDLVVASPHSALGQDDDAATERLLRAVEHPQVDVLGHPTGRLLGERPGLSPDLRRLAAAAAEHDTALEVNANPARLDLDGRGVRAAVEAGAPVAVDTDAHAPGEFDHVEYGVHTARRGWAEPADVLNTWSVEDLRAFLGP